MENTDNIKERFRFRVAVAKMEEETRIGIVKRSDYTIRRIGTAACACLILTTGIVFAKDIKNFIVEQFENFGLGNGVTTAIENDYICVENGELAEQDAKIVENNEIIDNIKLKYKVNQFMVTDSNISIDFHFEFENKINEYVNLEENIDYENTHIELSDLFIVDENNEVIYYNKYDNQLFKNYCLNNNLEYDSEADRYFNIINVRNSCIEDDVLGMEFSCIVNSLNDYPKSKQLNVYFSKINLYSQKENKNITLNGNWNFKLDIPEIMYNRKSEYYRVASCENSDFEVYEAKATDIGFELGIKISNIEEPVYPKELQERERELLKEKEFVERKYFGK